MPKYGLPLLPSSASPHCVTAFGAQLQKTCPTNAAILLRKHMAIIDDYGAIARRRRELYPATKPASPERTNEKNWRSLVAEVVELKRRGVNGGSIMPRSMPIYVGQRRGGAWPMD